MNKYLLFLPMAGMLMACSHKTANQDASSDETSSSVVTTVPVKVEPIASKPLGTVLKASAFRMTGDYADNVAITLDSQGNVVYYPAPSDLTADSSPIDLGNGWWLNRQGLSANSVFTKYTFKEYRNLSTAPSIKELKSSVIPGAHVSEMVQLPMPASEATSKIQEIKDYLKTL